MGDVLVFAVLRKMKHSPIQCVDMDMGAKLAPVANMPVEATVTLPPALAAVANRIAVEQHWTLQQAVIFLLKRGAKAQEDAERAVASSYDRFMQADAFEQEKTGDDLIRAIFGPESLA